MRKTCVRAVGKLLKNCAQVPSFYTQPTMQRQMGVHKQGSFFAVSATFLPRLFHDIQAANLSVVHVLIPIFHTTNKDNYEVYKLITN